MAVGSTAFTVFVFPESIASVSRRVIGGHVIGVLAVFLMVAALSTIAVVSTDGGVSYIVAIEAALSKGLGTRLMVATNTEHPPAAGTILGLMIHGWSWDAILFIIGTAVIISAIHIALRPKLINLI